MSLIRFFTNCHFRVPFLLLLLFPVFLNGQIIPTEWEGKWEGEVSAWGYNTKNDSFKMSLEIISQDSLWDFTIFYDREFRGKPDIRKYQLLIVDEAKSHLAIDEKNSIILDGFLNDNCMYNRFTGMGSDLQVRMCLEGDEMDYEITSYFSDPLRISGNEVIQNDTVPEIKSFELYYLMKATLKKPLK